MRHDNDNIDDLFRERLANKEMKLSNPNFPFNSKGGSDSSMLKSQNRVTKILKVLKGYRLVFVATPVVIVSVAYFIFSKDINNEPINNEQPVGDTISQNDTFVASPHNYITAKDSSAAEVPVVDGETNKVDKVRDSATVKQIPENVKTEKELNKKTKPANTENELKDLPQMEKHDISDIKNSDSINQTKQVDSTQTKIDEEEKPENVPKVDPQLTEPEKVSNDTTKSNTSDNKKKRDRKKRKVKKLR